jgi:hypothetical protein
MNAHIPDTECYQASPAHPSARYYGVVRWQGSTVWTSYLPFYTRPAAMKAAKAEAERRDLLRRVK